MTRAEQVKASLENGSMSWNDLHEEAQEIATEIDHDWDNECTTYKYADGSVAVFNGMVDSITAYGCE